MSCCCCWCRHALPSSSLSLSLFTTPLLLCNPTHRKRVISLLLLLLLWGAAGEEEESLLKSSNFSSSSFQRRQLRAAGLAGAPLDDPCNSSSNDRVESSSGSSNGIESSSSSVGVHGIAEAAPPQRIPLILALNKTDLATHPKWIFARAKEFQQHGQFQKIFHFSAKNKCGLGPLLDFLFSECKPGLWVYPPTMVTTLPKVEQVAELIRTYLFCWFNKDVPYRIQQQTIGWTPMADGSLAIEQVFFVKDEKVAKMICGVRGRLLLQLRKNVAYKLEQNWKMKVVLYVHVKALKQA